MSKPQPSPYRCMECGMLVDGFTFHPHVYCVLYNAGHDDPERYMEAAMPLLREHFPEAVE